MPPVHPSLLVDIEQVDGQPQSLISSRALSPISFSDTDEAEDEYSTPCMRDVDPPVISAAYSDGQLTALLDTGASDHIMPPGIATNIKNLVKYAGKPISGFSDSSTGKPAMSGTMTFSLNDCPEIISNEVLLMGEARFPILASRRLREAGWTTVDSPTFQGIVSPKGQYLRATTSSNGLMWLVVDPIGADASRRRALPPGTSHISAPAAPAAPAPATDIDGSTRRPAPASTARTTD